MHELTESVTVNRTTNSAVLPGGEVVTVVAAVDEVDVSAAGLTTIMTTEGISDTIVSLEDVVLAGIMPITAAGVVEVHLLIPEVDRVEVELEVEVGHHHSLLRLKIVLRGRGKFRR